MAGREWQPSGQMDPRSIFHVHHFIQLCFQSKFKRQEVEQYMKIHFEITPELTGKIWQRIENRVNQNSRMQSRTNQHSEVIVQQGFHPYQARLQIGYGNAPAFAFTGNVNVPGANVQVASGGSIHEGRPNNRPPPQQPQQQQQQQVNYGAPSVMSNCGSSPSSVNFSGSDSGHNSSGRNKKQKR